jgi:hypothetical protein
MSAPHLERFSNSGFGCKIAGEALQDKARAKGALSSFLDQYDSNQGISDEHESDRFIS